jgi:hypothetical protein
MLHRYFEAEEMYQRKRGPSPIIKIMRSWDHHWKGLARNSCTLMWVLDFPSSIELDAVARKAMPTENLSQPCEDSLQTLEVNLVGLLFH